MGHERKTTCDGPDCTKSYLLPQSAVATQSAPYGWLSAVQLRVAAPTNELSDKNLVGDFCSEKCLTDAIAKVRQHWQETGALHTLRL